MIWRDFFKSVSARWLMAGFSLLMSILIAFELVLLELYCWGVLNPSFYVAIVCWALASWSTILKALDRSSATRTDLWAGLVLFSPSIMKVLISHSAVVVRSSQQLGLRTGIDAGELLLPKDCQPPQVHVCIHSEYTHTPFFLFSCCWCCCY